MLSRSLARTGGLAALAALALLAVLSLLPAATPTAGANTNARVRAVHAVPDFGPVDVYVNGAKALGDVSFFAVSDYLSVPAGDYLVQVVPAGENVGSPSLYVINDTYTLEAGKDYSLVARGTADPLTVADTVIEDTNTPPALGSARFRAAHFSPGAPNVDIYVNGQRQIQNLAFNSVSPYLEVPAGTYAVGIAPTGGNPIYTINVTLAANTVATAWANGLLTGTGAQAFKVTSSEDASFPPARVRAVHAVPDIAGSPVDVYVNATKVVTFDFFDASDYVELPAGTYDVRVVLAGGNPATEAVIQANVTVEGGKDYSIVARGTGSGIGASVLEDDNSRPVAGSARVRVAHFAPDAPAVDLFINGERSPVQGLSFPNATAYLEIPAGEYAVGVAPAGGTPIYTATLAVEPGKVYTAWANGLLAGTGARAFKVTPTVDADYPTAFVRLLHAVPNAPAVDILVGGSPVAQGVSFGGLSGFLPIYAGTYPVEIRPAGGATAVISGSLTVAGGRAYTAAAVGLLGGSPAASLALFEESQAPVTEGRSRVKVVHLSPDAPAVDVVSGGETLLNALTFGNAGIVEVPAGLYPLGVALDAGGAEVLSATLNLSSGTSTTVFAIGSAANPEAEALRLLAANSFVDGAPAQTFRVYLPRVSR